MMESMKKHLNLRKNGKVLVNKGIIVQLFKRKQTNSINIYASILELILINSIYHLFFQLFYSPCFQLSDSLPAFINNSSGKDWKLNQKQVLSTSMSKKPPIKIFQGN